MNEIPLNPSETLIANLSYFVSGVKDATRFAHVWRQLADDVRIRSNVIKCTFIQLVLLSSVFVLDFIIAPSLSKKGLQADATGRVGLYFEFLFLWPLLGLSFFFSGSVHPKLQQDPALSSSRSQSKSYGVKLFDSVTRSLTIISVFVINFTLYRIPLIGWFLSLIYMCVIDGYWCFEYAWTNRGWDFKEKAKFLEERWAYFAGFGFPCTIISFFHPSPLINLALFSLVFPLNLLLASTAKPVPAGDASSDLLSASSGMAKEKMPVYWKYWPTRLPVLWLSRILADSLNHPSVKRLFLGRNLNKKSAVSPSAHSHAQTSSYFTPSSHGGGLYRPQNTPTPVNRTVDRAYGSAAGINARPGGYAVNAPSQRRSAKHE